MAQRLPPLGPKRLVVSKSARSDFSEIIGYIADSAGDAVAKRYAKKLDASLQRLAGLGHAGVPRDDLSDGLRLHVFGSYCVYFRVSNTETRIVRVLRASRDIADFRFEPE